MVRKQRIYLEKESVENEAYWDEAGYIGHTGILMKPQHGQIFLGMYARLGILSDYLHETIGELFDGDVERGDLTGLLLDKKQLLSLIEFCKGIKVDKDGQLYVMARVDEDM